MMVLMPIALDTDDAGVCGQERGGVDGWTGGRVGRRGIVEAE